jgi:uncharacterized protein (DUF1697 family)
MALVVLLRGVNMAGHKTLRPTILTKQLKHLDAVNIGAAGTFVVRRSASRTRLRAEFARRLPFDAQIVICRGRDILRIMHDNPFGRYPVRKDIVRFVSVLSHRPRLESSLPKSFPSKGKWQLRIVGRDGPFVFGLYRRSMKVIRYFGVLDRLFGVKVTSRNWNTITTIARVIGTGGA